MWNTQKQNLEEGKAMSKLFWCVCVSYHFKCICMIVVLCTIFPNHQDTTKFSFTPFNRADRKTHQPRYTLRQTHTRTHARMHGQKESKLSNEGVSYWGGGWGFVLEGGVNDWGDLSGSSHTYIHTPHHTHICICDLNSALQGKILNFH